MRAAVLNLHITSVFINAATSKFGGIMRVWKVTDNRGAAAVSQQNRR